MANRTLVHPEVTKEDFVQGEPDYVWIYSRPSPARYVLTGFQQNLVIVERDSSANEPTSLTQGLFPVKVRSWSKIYHP